MNLLKSIFISSCITLVMAITGYAGWMLYPDENPIAWSGVMLTAGLLLTVITRLMLCKNVARTSAHFPFINFLAAVGVSLVFGARYGIRPEPDVYLDVLRRHGIVPVAA
ncbi:MAG: hypothetical protein EPN89_07175 [Methylovulum sp.]|nr:MAG: hypothetical protein EPN89_07175 [Methylovulum sp.]